MAGSASGQAGSGRGVARPDAAGAASTPGQRAAVTEATAGARRLRLLLAGASAAPGAPGAAGFFRFPGQGPPDPGGGYRDPPTLDNPLQPASRAAPAGAPARPAATHQI